jgi:hypothetical protein
MEASRPSTTIPPANPPSVEIAYKRKCIALKRRLAEIETENELMRTRNSRSHQYIQKMRLETCMLLERLNKITGMSEEAKAGAINSDLRARAAAMMTSSGVPEGTGATLEDDTEGSSDEQPRTVRSSSFRLTLRTLPSHLSFTSVLPSLSSLIYCCIWSNISYFLARGTSPARQALPQVCRPRS